MTKTEGKESTLTVFCNGTPIFTSHGKWLHPVWLKISAVSTPLKLLRLSVYWTARSRHGLHPEEGL
jgi:hypothetical protein